MQNNKDLFLVVKNIYGKKRLYPACSTSIKLCTLIGTRTLTRSNLKTLLDLGYSYQISGDIEGVQ